MWQMAALFIILAAVIGLVAYGIHERVRYSKLAQRIPYYVPNRSNWYK
jgi:hypothetical protein